MGCGLRIRLDWAATMPALMRIASQHFGARRIGPCMSILVVVHHGAAAATTFVVGAADPAFNPLAFGIGGLLCLMAGFLLILNHRLPMRLEPYQAFPAGHCASRCPPRSSAEDHDLNQLEGSSHCDPIFSAIVAQFCNLRSYSRNL